MVSCTYELWKVRLLKTKQKEKNIKSKTLRPVYKKNLRLWDAVIIPKWDFETHQKHVDCDFEIRPKFSETHVFRGTISIPLALYSYKLNHDWFSCWWYDFFTLTFSVYFFLSSNTFIPFVDIHHHHCGLHNIFKKKAMGLCYNSRPFSSCCVLCW